MVVRRGHIMAWITKDFFEMKSFVMKSQMRQGYENHEEQLEKTLGFLSEYLAEEIERPTHGSFYVLSLKT